jgi:hypothetical protein
MGRRGLFARMAGLAVRPRAPVPRGPLGGLNPTHGLGHQEGAPRARTRSDDVFTD